jgi:hypothetical protein
MRHITKSSHFWWSVIVGALAILAYIFTWQFYAVYWLVLSFANLIIAVFFLVVIVQSVVFGATNGKKYKGPFIPLYINVMVITILCYLPPTDHSKHYPKGTYSLAKRIGPKYGTGLYLKCYMVFGGGAGSTDVNAIYLTDNKNFRLFLGVFDEYYDAVDVQCNGDQIIATKKTLNGTNIKSTNWKCIWKKTFSLKSLKAGHAFE